MDVCYPFYICYSRKKIIAAVVLCLLLFLFCGWLWWADHAPYFDGMHYRYSESSLLMPPAMIVILAYTIRKSLLLRHKDPLITLTREGVSFHNDLSEAVGTVTWGDITRCADFVEGWKKVRYLHIEVRNPEQYLDRICDAGVHRKIEHLSRKKNGALLWINTTYLDSATPDLKKYIYQGMGNTNN